MAGRLRGVLLGLLAAALAGGPTHVVAAPSAVLTNPEASEPLAGSEEAVPPRGVSPRVVGTGPAPAGVERRPAARAASGPTDADVRRVPRHVWFCVWRE